MTDHEHGDDVKEDLLASLLTRAPLRPTPRPDAAARAYATLHAQWRSDVVRRKRRWRVAWLALAATVVAAIGLVAMLPAPSTEPVAVARLAHLSGGTATIGNARSRVRSPVTAGTPVMSGEIVRTGTDARIALAWHDGGSLRLRENTALEFTTPVTVRLLRGTVYFDSGAVAAAGTPSPGLRIATLAGTASHVGTQYMLEQEDSSVTLTVREGMVELHGSSAPHTVGAGRQLTAHADGSSSIGEASVVGPQWDWVASTSPGFESEHASAYEFLLWYARETGRTVVFANSAQRTAKATPLIGFGQLSPTFATLTAVSNATDLNVEIVADQIRVSVRSAP